MSTIQQTLSRVFGVSFTQLPDLTELRQYQHPNAFCCDARGELLGVFSSENACTELHIPAGWQHLEYLNVSDNKGLQSLAFEAPLPRLQHLDASGCQLEVLRIPAGFRALKNLYLQKNRLKTLNLEEGSPNLQLLDASGNELETLHLPEGFSSLAYLFLMDNALETFTFEGVLPSLTILHLRNNRLQNVPAALVLSGALEAFYAAGNAPKNIPKLFLGDPDSYKSENCLEDARLWFAELRDYPSERNKAVKLMLTGNGNSGKSTLLCALENGRCDHDHTTTHGIQIKTLGGTDIRFNVWDFGGQEVYHGTHRLFMEAEALQVILFDPKTEASARNNVQVEDRSTKEPVFNHPIEYWYETASELSPNSQFFLVQNKKDEAGQEDKDIRNYADDKAKFLHLSAKTGEDVDDLMHFLRKNAKLLPDFEMLMPLSWLGVRQFFIDNLQKETHREKIISKEKFEALCVAHNVSEATRPLLFKYLHHSGFLYYHEYLGDKIIADQSWALEAIYQPLKREADHYAEFRDQWKGKIWLNRLFQVFGAGYSPDEKKLFLSFMESCGLCFRMNKESEDAYDPKAVYIFPEFLPPDKPQRLVYEWEQKAKEVRVLRYPMRWNNYFLVRSFITALGRKTSTDHIWRNGIHVSTPEGWFKVELDRAAKSILLYIEASAMPAWLEAILEELRKDREHASWEISSDYGNTYLPFDLEKWKQTRREKIAPSHAEMTEGTHPSDPLPKRLPDVPQVDERQVILFLAANPTDSQLSLGNEFLLIYHKLQEHTNRFLLFTEMGISADRMNEAISSKSPTIIHFVGHGKVQNPDTKKGGGLILHSEDYQGGKEVDAEKLEKMFKLIKEDHPGLKVVVLNACYTEPQAIAISTHDIYAIGVNDIYNSLPAKLFAAGFYWQYAEKPDDIRAAVRFGLRQALAENKNIEDLVHLFHNGQRLSI